MKSNIKKSAFTLIELLVSILIISIIIIAGFYALTHILTGRLKLTERINLEKETYYFTEKLYSLIKEGGTIDYEQYFEVYLRNYDETQQAISPGLSDVNKIQKPDGSLVYRQNYGNAISNVSTRFYCLNVAYSGNLDGCIHDTYRILKGRNILNSGRGDYVRGHYWEYGQYALNYIDYDTNNSLNGLRPNLIYCDGSDPDCLIGDDNDMYLGNGPVAFRYPSEYTDNKFNYNNTWLYLINRKGDERTVFRLKILDDPDIPTTCGKENASDVLLGNDGCRGELQFLKLVGKDLGGYRHISNPFNDPEIDGKIDTWYIHPDFTADINDDINNYSTLYEAGGSETEASWKPVFSDTISISNLKFEPYPNKDPGLAFGDNDVQISPYVRISLDVSPSGKARKKIRGKTPSIHISTTIALTDLYSN